MEAQLLENSIRLATSATQAPITLYVDGAAGSDDLGDGSVGSPFATPRAACAALPKILRHECQIVVAGGVYMKVAGRQPLPEHIDYTYENDGSLAIVCTGVPDVTSGPHEVTGVSALGTGATRLAVAAGGLGGVDGLVGSWVRSPLGVAYRVEANGANYIDIVTPFVAPIPSVGWHVITPATMFEIDELTVHYRKAGTYKAGAYSDCRFVLHNCILLLATSVLPRENISIKGPASPFDGVVFDFVSVAHDGHTFPVAQHECNVNPHAARSTAYAAVGGTGLTNVGGSLPPGLTVRGGGAATRTDTDYMLSGRASVGHVTVFGQVQARGSRTFVFAFGFGSYNAVLGAHLQLMRGVVAGKTGSPVGLASEASDLSHTDVYFERGSNAIELSDRSRLMVTATACDAAAITGRAVTVGASCVVVQKGALAAFVGASAGGDKAYQFSNDAAVESDTWLAANHDAVTDSKGAFIVRED